MQANLEAVGRSLRNHQLLLVLDSFEHVIGAATDLASLLAACPDLKVLVTSRAALHLRSEHSLQITPLALPNRSAPINAASIADVPSVALFVERAQAARPDFELTDINAHAVAEICARLDGLPLGIELAAARAMVLSPEAMRVRLEQGLTALPRGSRDLPLRQQTLHDAIAWSYDLLDANEQSVFRQLGIFMGGFTLEAAASIAQPVGKEPSLQESRRFSLEVLSGLVTKSLVISDGSVLDEPRFRMLETIREYACGELRASDDYEATHVRHARYFMALAERGEQELAGSHQVMWLDRLDLDRPNFMAALSTAVSQGDAHLAMRLGAALARYWHLRGYIGEGRQVLERTAASSADVDDELTAKMLRGAARLAAARGDWSTAREFLGSSTITSPRVETATSVEGRALLALVLQRLGDRARALALARDTEARASAFGEQWLTATVLEVLGEIALSQGNYVGAASRLGECVELAHAAGLASHIATGIEGLAVVAAARGWPERALRLAASANRLRDDVRIPTEPAQRDLLERRLASARAAVNEGRRSEVWAEGYTRTMEEAVRYALENQNVDVAAPEGPTVAPEVPWLTARERQVAALVAEGLRNQQIAERLGIALNTVEVHMTRILNKLGMPSRAQLAAWATTNGLKPADS